MQEARTSQSSLAQNPKSPLPVEERSSESERQPRRPRWRSSKQGPVYQRVRSVNPQWTERKISSHLDDQNLFALVLLYVSLTVPIILLLSWWMFVYRGRHLSLIRSEPIGGRLDFIVAKGIDVLCSAILAPLGMAFLNLLWFRLARISVFNEKDHDPVSLKALLELSITYGGTYDPWKLLTLFRASRSRFTLFAFLTLLSAISTSLFVNVIAYEAIQVKQNFPSNSNFTLRELPEYSSMFLVNESRNSLSKDVSRQLHNNFASTMYSISHSMDRDMDDENRRLSDSYFGLNITKKSLYGVPPDVKELWNVPAFILKVKCEPANITRFNITPPTLEEDIHKIRAELSDKTIYDGYTELTPTQLKSLYSHRFRFALQNNKSVLLAVYDVMASPAKNGFQLPDGISQPSDFGLIRSTTVDLYKNSTYEFYTNVTNELELKRQDNVYGIICRIQRQQGLTNLTASNDLESSRKWTSGNITFIDDDSSNTINYLHEVSRLVRKYRPPSSIGPYWDSVGEVLGTGAGDGPNYWKIDNVLLRKNPTKVQFTANPTNFTVFAYNFLYAAGRMETAVWDIDMTHSKQITKVSGIEEVLRYRISYIPGLLVAGLITISISAAIVFGMTWYSLGTLSAHTDRVLDGLRFVSDFVSAVREDELLADANTWTRNRLDRFGWEVKLRYFVERGSLRLRRGIASEEKEGRSLLSENGVVGKKNEVEEVEDVEDIEQRGEGLEIEETVPTNDGGTRDFLVDESEIRNRGGGSLRGKGRLL